MFILHILFRIKIAFICSLIVGRYNAEMSIVVDQSSIFEIILVIYAK